MEKKLVIHLVKYSIETISSMTYYANSVIFDNNHIFRTVWRMPDGYELNICTIPYTDSSHSIFKEKFIEPFLGDDGYIKDENFGKVLKVKFPVFDVNLVILNEFNKKYNGSNGK